MKPFLIEITETSKRQVLVVADNESAATTIAEDQVDLLSWGKVDLAFDVRTVEDPSRYRDQKWATPDGPMSGEEALGILGSSVDVGVQMSLDFD